MLIRLDRVTHAFNGGHELFQPITTPFARGEMVAVTGRSGSGKSTLLAILAGYLAPSAGAVQRGEDCRVCWVAQQPRGVAGRSALDHVALPILATGARRSEAERRAGEFLDQLGLSDASSQPFETLSGGQAQRLMLAQGLAAAPDVLVVDEPTAQLDHRTAAEVDAVLGMLAAAELLVVVATHSPATRASCSRELALDHSIPSE
ncbi:ATP-binding cassette domain-containing protein [Agromyces soli]|uniref:ATP-binding cassette domain-containing protein n=1 Tax=Agromyces soli TaxID=659012 RepID=A0ABY4AY12_9MICO|nr:ATP-binding cassette domain-containing protein [Agromyces soli]UOE27001.1 ATP-binding cassette domain-containing protein [Agromyces soli]